MKPLCLFLFISLLGTTLPCNSQENWDLERCINQAIISNITINQANISVEQAKVNLGQDKQRSLPNFSGSTSANWNFGRTIDPTSNEFITETFFANRFGVNTGMVLYSGRTISNQIKQSKIELEATRNDAQQTKQDIALQVASNFLNVLFAEENINVSRRQLQLNQQQLDQTLRLITAGTRAESEKFNLEAQVAQSEQDLIVSENNYAIAMLQLKQVLRLDPSYPLSIIAPENVNFTTDPELVLFEEAFAEARKSRPDLSSSDLRVQSADLGVQIAKGNLTPTLSIGGSLGTTYSNQGRSVEFIPTTVETQVTVSSSDPRLPLNNVPVTLRSDGFDQNVTRPGYFDQFDNNLSYGFGVSLNIPIYNNGITRSNIQRSKLTAENARLNYDQLLENLKITVQQSLADARAAKKKLQASEKTLEAQRLAFENMSKRLDVGSANTFEWQQQKTQMENAEIQQLIDKYDYLFKIKILEFYLGKPLKL